MPIKADHQTALEYACKRALIYRHNSDTIPPGPVATVAELRTLLDSELPTVGEAGCDIIKQLADAAEQGLIGISSPHFYGWVMGASHPVGVAADWLAASWGQNAAIYQTSPAAAVAEEISSRWLLQLLNLPPSSSVGFTTGATMASFICLSAARADVLTKAGWSLDEDGLNGSPAITVFVSQQAHATIFGALRYLGFGKRHIKQIDADSQGRMLVDDLAAKITQVSGPKIIICQAGHINSGAFDPFDAIVKLAKSHNAWLHADGAFGLWVQCVPEKSHYCDGIEHCDSWSVDGHKWLQVPYDSGFAIINNPQAHQRAMDITASYLNAAPDDARTPCHYVPELSRRARGFAVWAVIKSLGRSGIREIVARHCDCARHLQQLLSNQPGITILNDVVINQLAIAFGESQDMTVNDRYTEQVIANVQAENRVYVSGASWQNRQIMRVSIISQHTSSKDIELLADSIIRAWQQV